MLSVKALQEQLAKKMDEVKAVHSLCEKETREPTAEETALINAAIGEDGQGGEVAKIKARIVQAEAFEREVAEQSKIRSAVPVHTGGSDADSGSMFARIRVPVSARARAPVKTFAGPTAEQEAFAFGRMVQAMWGSQRADEWCRDSIGFSPRAAMSEGSDSDGGFLVPGEFESSLIRLVNEYGVARRVCQLVPMRSDTKTQPRRTGGLTAYAIGEISAPTESSPTVDQVQLIAKKFGVLTKYSRDLEEDSAIAVAGMVAAELALAFAYKEDSCLFNGDGTSTYGGIVGIKESLAAGSTVTASAANKYSELLLTDFESMIAALPSYAFMDGGPQWYLHRSAWATSMLRLAAAAGGNTTREITGGVQTQFLGYPVNFVEVMNNTLTDQNDAEGVCYFGNLRQGVMFGDRRGVTVDTSREVAFTTQQITVLGTERFDINVHNPGTASAAGSIIMLKMFGS